MLRRTAADVASIGEVVDQCAPRTDGHWWCWLLLVCACVVDNGDAMALATNM